MSFTHLHNHSEYSLLNGAIRIPEMVKKAKEMGYTAVGLSDYGNMFGSLELFLEAKKAGIKPVIGCTVFIPSHDQHTLRQFRRGLDSLYQLVLIIQNETGYLNLCQLITKSYLEGFYYKPRVDTALLKEFSEGLIALSGGFDGPINAPLYDGKKQEAMERLDVYSKIFPGRFYVELQENGLEGQHELNLELVELAKQKKLPVVATNNCHYLNREDSEAFEALMCIQTGGTLHGANDRLKFSTDGYYFKSPAEMEEVFEYCPEALANTQTIVDQVNFKFNLDTYHFPKFTPPEGKTLDEFLVDEAYVGLEKRWPAITKNGDVNKTQYEDRLKEELRIIKQTGFSGYFLIVSDFIRYAKNNGIPVGPGRGSAAGSLVAYCTDITDVDPIPYNLLFERFLNPERISMPDVDIDFCMNQRDKVLQYVAKKYGNVSQIITFGKMKARGVLRDVGRVLNIPLEQVDKIAKLVPNQLNITLEEALKIEPRLEETITSDPQLTRLMEIAKKLEGLARHASTHAAGVVISDKPLSDFLPLYRGGNEDIVTQFDMKGVEKIGLIKFDFLGLKTLTIIDHALKIIKRTRGEHIQILDIPIDDKAVFELLCRGDTDGVFQLESEGMKDVMVRLKPSTFEDLIALVALYRPGPLGSGMVDDFINRKQGKTPIVYDLPELKPILEDTYGVIVYQEQVMQIASALAGYSLGEADLLRRAMGKKKAEEMASQKERFLKGAAERSVPKDKAEKIFDLMAKFAEYGFNKSHSAAYALVSYQTAYLKAHYPVETVASILTHEMHDTDKVLFYIQDARRHGIEILPPNVNESYYGFSVLDDLKTPNPKPEIRNRISYGLGAIKGVGEGAIESIIEARESFGGQFENFFKFLERIDHRRVNKRVLEALVKAGALDLFGEKRKNLFEALEKSVDWALKRQADKKIGQNSLFAILDSTNPVGLTINSGGLDWLENEKLSFEKEAFGFYFSGHPLKSYEGEIKKVSSTNSHLCQQLPTEQKVVMAGIFSKHRVITTKKGNRMAFATLEDLQGTIEVILFPDVYQDYAELVTEEKPVVLKGVIDRSEEGTKIIADELIKINEFLNMTTKSVHFKIPVIDLNEDRLINLQNILKEYPGECRSYLHVIAPGESETVMELPQGINLGESETFSAKVNALFQARVVEYGI